MIARTQMWRILIALALFTAAQLVGAAVFDLIDGSERLAIGTLPELWMAVPWLPVLVAPVWAGWRALSLLEVALLGPCGALAYLAFLFLTGQLSAEPDPVDGSAMLLVNVALFALGAWLLSATGWVAHRILRRVRDRAP